jgi:hypothetical protein
MYQPTRATEKDNCRQQYQGHWKPAGDSMRVKNGRSTLHGMDCYLLNVSKPTNIILKMQVFTLVLTMGFSWFLVSELEDLSLLVSRVQDWLHGRDLLPLSCKARMQ